MEGHIRGDEDEFVLLDEMGGGREAASSPTTDKNALVEIMIYFVTVCRALLQQRRRLHQEHIWYEAS